MKLIDLSSVETLAKRSDYPERQVLEAIAAYPFLIGCIVYKFTLRDSDLKKLENIGIRLKRYEDGYILVNWLDHIRYTLHEAVKLSNTLWKSKGLPEQSLDKIDWASNPEDQFIKQRISELEQEIETLKSKLK